MDAIRNRIDQFVSAIGKMASWLTVLLVVLIGVDVILRYILNWNSSANQELEWHLFAALFLLGAAYTLQHDKHVRVDVFYCQFNEIQKAWVNMIGSILFLIPFCLVVTWTSIPFVADAWQINESSPEPGGLPHRFLIKSTIPLGAGLLLLQGVSVVLSSISKILTPASS